MITVAAIQPYIENKLVSVQPHPENGDICIFNYTQKCQFSKAWDDITTRCRGLILNVSTGQIVANPFPKFFNYGEREGVTVPAEAPVITKKYDGSLGILYWLPGETKPRIATRGSFTSDQALWATAWLQNHIDCSRLLPTMTYLFEIIYPENRIVVNYDWSGLVLLGVKHVDAVDHEFDTQEHAHLVPVMDMHPAGYGRTVGDVMRVAERIAPTDLEALKAMDQGNEEGFVIHYPQAELRLKVKFPEYVRLHRLVTGVSAKAIWELMMNNQSFDDLLEKVPDEFYQWVSSTTAKIQADFDKVLAQVDHDWTLVNHAVAAVGDKGRKTWAEHIKNSRCPGLLFARLDGKDESELIYRMIKPVVEKPFKQDADL